MKKYIRIFGIIILLCFSFYYTDKIAEFMKTKDPIYESILAVSDEYKIDSVDAVIENDTIIPGLKGQVVNVQKSFQNMKNYGFFRETDLVFDAVEPIISLKENQDKIITQGNKMKNAVSFLVDDELIVGYFEEIGIPYAVLTNEKNVNYNRSIGLKINNDLENYDQVEKSLKLRDEKSSFCYAKKEQLEFCQKKKKQLFKETLSLNKTNFASVYKKILPGSILYLNSNLGLANIKILISQIYFQGLNIISLEDLVSEMRN